MRLILAFLLFGLTLMTAREWYRIFVLTAIFTAVYAISSWIAVLAHERG